MLSKILTIPSTSLSFNAFVISSPMPIKTGDFLSKGFFETKSKINALYFCNLLKALLTARAFASSATNNSFSC